MRCLPAEEGPRRSRALHSRHHFEGTCALVLASATHTAHTPTSPSLGLVCVRTYGGGGAIRAPGLELAVPILTSTDTRAHIRTESYPASEHVRMRFFASLRPTTARVRAVGKTYVQNPLCSSGSMRMRKTHRQVHAGGSGDNSFTSLHRSLALRGGIEESSSDASTVGIRRDRGVDSERTKLGELEFGCAGYGGWRARREG
ncbi:hypothetical protein B0H13DRAFT_2532688 [Mycena leptocephala]|nr:hypothetical protein B0H13DRAFT_2532688 [Mycena leptocephala]